MTAPLRFDDLIPAKPSPAAPKAVSFSDLVPQKKGAETWSPRGKALSVAREAIGQGALFGFGEEAEALVSSLFGNRSYEQERERIRGEMAEFREAYPKTAMASSLVGGLAVPGGTARSLGGAALRSAAAGGLAGIGAAEGDIREQAASGVLGAVTGGVLGTAVQKGGQVLAERAQRLGRAAPAEVSSVMRRAEAAGMRTPQAIQQRATTVLADAPEAQVVDVIGEPAVRRMRTIRTMGGAPGQQVEEAMQGRLEQRPERLIGALRRTTGRERENIVQTLEESVQRGKQESTPLYRQFYAAKPEEIPTVDEILQTPFGRTVVERARRNAANERRRFIEPEQPSMDTGLIDEFGQPIMTEAKAAKHYPQSLDDIKKAMDDIIYEGRFGGVQPGQGGLQPGELRVAKQLRGAFLNAVDDTFADYAEARAAWAGEKAVRDALESGVEAATKRVDPREVARDVAGLDAGEVEYFQRGYLDGLSRKIDEGRLRPSTVNTPAFKNMLAAVFQDDADNIANALKEEMRMMGRAQSVLQGSQSIEKARDLAEEASAQSAITRALQVATSPMRTMALSGLGALERSLISPRYDAMRGREVQEFLRPASAMGPLLSRIEQELGVQRRAGQIGGRLGQTGAIQTGLGIGERNR